jgi:O-antigen/teichoic acid export membrane protein
MSLRDFLNSDRPLARVLSNLGWLMAGKGFGAVLSLFYLALATQLLGPEQFGYFTLVLGTAQAISGIVAFQSWQLVIRFGNHNLVQDGGSSEDNDRLITFCILLDIGAAIVGLLLAAVVITIFADRFGWTRDFTVTALLFAAVMLFSVKSSAIGALRLYDRFRDDALAAAVIPLMRMLGAIAAWNFAPSVKGFLAAWATAEISAATAYWLLVRAKTPIRFARSNFAGLQRLPSRYTDFYRFAFITNGSATLKAMAQQVPLLIVGFFAGPAAAGFFRLAYQLKDAASRFAEMLSRSLYAEFSSLHARGNADESAILFGQLRNVAAIAALLLMSVAYFAGAPILTLIAGPEFLPAYPILLILAGASAVELFGVGHEPRLMAIGKPHISLIIRAVSAIALMAIMIFLLPRWGAVGAAYAVLSYSVLSISMLLWYNRRAAR